MTAQEIRLTARQFRTLIHSNADGMLVIDRKHARVRFANPAALALLGRAVHEVVDQPLGLPGSAAGEATEIHVVRSDGRHRVAEMRAVEIEWDGAPAWLASLRDMTERKEAEETLAQERDFVAAVLETLGALVLVLTPQGQIIRANRACCELLGHDPTGRSFGELFESAEEFDPCKQAIERLEWSLMECEAPVRTADGRKRSVAWRITRGVQHVIITGIDVTDLESARKDLEAHNRMLSEARLVAETASRAKSHFLATMSHEIRTPLNGILGTLDLLRQLPLDLEQRELTDLMHLSAEGLQGIVSNILDFSKIESGRLELAAEPFELRERLGQLVRVLRPEAASRGLALEMEVGADTPDDLVGDWGRLRQVLVNLLGNAIKFTAAGRIRLDVECLWSRGGRVCLQFAVQDTGIGIPADKLPTVFSPFTQVEEPTIRRHPGTGLGLAIASELVKTMGGRLEAESTPGVGSRFHFGALFQTRQSPPEATPAETQACPAGLRVLLAEDNHVNQRVTMRLLERRGWRVALAATGPEAMDLLGREAFDVVLLDVEMPDVSGFDVVKWLRQREHGTERHTPVVAVTAHCVSGYRERCLAAGMDLYLAKPFTADALYRVISEATLRAR